MRNKKGFSLIELMVGIAIIITATTVVLSIIVSSFRISNKTTASDTVRQNGNSAVAQISRIFQFADSFVGAANRSDFADLSYSCDETSYNHIRVVYQGNLKTVSCSGSGLLLDGNSIIDNSLTVSDCSLTCTRDIGAGPVLGLNFNLSRGGSNTSAEQTSSIKFSTKIKMRNAN